MQVTLRYWYFWTRNFAKISLDVITDFFNDLTIIHLTQIRKFVFLNKFKEKIVDKCVLCDTAGITPAISNEVGVYIEPDSYEMAMLPRNTRVNAHRVKAIKDRRNCSNSSSIAVPNDRSQSVRPSDRNLQFEFVFKLFSWTFDVFNQSIMGVCLHKKWLAAYSQCHKGMKPVKKYCFSTLQSCFCTLLATLVQCR